MELWVGFLLGSGMVIFVVFLIIQGGTKELFSSRVHLTTTCARTYGLHPGSQIKMIDLVIGNVGKVTVDENGKVDIEMRINKERMGLIRQNPNNFDVAKGSTVILRTAGMGIGEAFLEITAGSSSLPAAQDNQALPFVTPTDKFEETMVSVKKLIDALNDDRHTLGKLLHDEGAYYESILKTLKNTADITSKMSGMFDLLMSKEGTVGAFLHDRKFYDNMVQIQEQSKRLMAELIEITKNASQVSERFAELAKKQETLFESVQSIAKKGDGLMSQFSGLVKKADDLTALLIVVAKDFTAMSGEFPDMAKKGSQTMSSARDVMNALKKNFLIKPFIAQPSDDALLEIIPRAGGK